MRALRHLASLMLLIAPHTMAAPALSGDVNQDTEFNAPDVVILTNVVTSPEQFSGETAAIADANQDGVLNSADASTVAEIIVGLRSPLPLGSTAPAAPLSFSFPPATVATERNAVAAISFLRPIAATAIEENAVVRAAPSYDYPEP
jgi:hypothetical protein